MTENPNTFPYVCDICKEFRKAEHGFLDYAVDDPKEYRHGETGSRSILRRWR